MRHLIEAREYKLLLEAEHFGRRPSLKDANAFWEDQLKPIIDGRLDKRTDGTRYENAFQTVSERSICFLDTSGCVLTNCDYALRVRAPLDGRDRGSQITLKLRTPDLFVVASTILSGNRDGARTQFEEDIAPLGIADPKNAGNVTIASPPSVRSRFALSTSQDCAPATKLRRFRLPFCCGMFGAPAPSSFRACKRGSADQWPAHNVLP